MHWGTFRLTDEPIDEPVRRLGKACAIAGIPDARFRVLRHGETVVVDSAGGREP
jgi:N-acyl-phosphatidylethanolamine-hydrolysing phospholipase D